MDQYGLRIGLIACEPSPGITHIQTDNGDMLLGH